MKNILISICLFFAVVQAWAIDTYDGTYLTIPLVAVGSTTYSNVVATVDKVISLDGGYIVGGQDAYDAYTGILSIPSVLVGDKTYTNVKVSVGKVISVEGIYSTVYPINVVKGASTVLDFRKYGTTTSSYNLRSGLIADLNSDGKNEFVFSVTTHKQYPIPLTVLGDDSGQINLTSKFFAGEPPSVMHSPSIYFSDINEDGKKDIIASEAGLDVSPWTGSKIGVALSNGSTYTNISSLIPDTTLRNYGAAIGSFDGNNKTQIYLQNYDSINSRNNTAVLTYTNNAFQTTSPLPLWSGVNIKSESYVAAADFNGDGFDDVLISGGWTDRANIIVYGSKKGLDPNTLNQLPSGPYGQDNYDFNKSWPPKIILSDAEYNALSFDFNGDGKPDIFSVSHQEIYYPEGTFQDTSNTNYNSFGVGQGGSYYGNSAYNTLTNIDGKNFKSTVPISSDLGSKYYVQIMKYDINQDGFMDVIGLYYTKMFRDSRTNMLMGSMTGTTLFLNDGKGNFKVVDALDVFPQLSTAPYTFQNKLDNRLAVGYIIPISNGVGGFTGLQLITAPNNTGIFTVQKFTSAQITSQNLSPALK